MAARQTDSFLNELRQFFRSNGLLNFVIFSLSTRDVERICARG